MSELIFVSYARADGNFVLRLARDLRAANVQIWMDQLDIRTGDTWDQAVEDALLRCTGLLVVLSPSAVSSRSVMDEVSFALDEDKKVFPVLYQPCKVPFRLRRVHWTDFTSDYAAGLSKLAAALGEAPQSPARGGKEERRSSSSEELDARAAESRSSATRAPSWSERHPRLISALWLGPAGGVLAAVAELMLYGNDPRTGTGMAPSLLVTMFGGGIIAGLLWAVAGTIIGGRRVPLMSAVVISLVVGFGWIAIGGTAADVLGASVIAGWPIGGIIGAMTGVGVLKMRGREGSPRSGG